MPHLHLNPSEIIPLNVSTNSHNDEPFLHLNKLQVMLARISNPNQSQYLGSQDNTNTASTLNIDYSYNYTDYYDMANTCFDMDCIWDRARKERIHILKPLTFILSLIGLIGIVGNIFVILVFSRTVQKRTSTYLVVMLAIIDLIACSIVIPGTLLKEWLFEFKIDLVCKLLELMRTSAIISSAMILAAIAFDRFLLVYRRNAQDGNRHVTMAMILVTVLTGIGLGVPPMLGEGVYVEYIDGGVVNIKVCLTNEQLITQAELNIYWQVVTSLFSLLIFIIIVLYTLIFIMVYNHSARVKCHRDKMLSTNARASSERLKPSRLSAMLPFVGFSRIRNTVQPQHDKDVVVQVNTKPWAVTARLQKLFKTKVSPQNNPQNVITIKVIGNSTNSNDSAIDSDSQTEPSPSQSATPRSHDLNLNNHENPSANQNHLSPFQTNQKPASGQSSSSRRLQDLYLRNQSAHIKTTKVLCIITIVYIIAFLPMFLITHGAITQNMLAFYLYFINNAANPIIYSFMNRKFRQDVSKMFACSGQSTTVWQG